MIDKQSAEGQATSGDNELSLVPRRRLLTLGTGAMLLAAAMIGLTSCGTPHFDSDRGLFVLQPKK